MGSISTHHNKPIAPTVRLTTSQSILLDVVRITAAIVVAFGHISQPYLSSGWVDRTDWARCSVAVFFLLSGFVIRYITCARPETIAHYFADRASRLYSIVLPALLFTLIADSISRHVNPAVYQPWARNYHNPVFAIFINLLFIGQCWLHPIEPLSNTPFWSLFNEAIYYALYGCWFYLTGNSKWIYIALLCLLAGPRVLLLAPLWILGCILCDMLQQWSAGKFNSRTTWLCAGFVLALLAYSSVAMHLQMQWFTGLALRIVHVMQTSNISPADYCFGVLWSLPFFAMLYFVRGISIARDSAFAKFTRFISEGTFPIYLIHLPLFILIAACVPYNHASAAANFTILFSVVAVGILAGHPGNILKLKLRALFYPMPAATTN